MQNHPKTQTETEALRIIRVTKVSETLAMRDPGPGPLGMSPDVLNPRAKREALMIIVKTGWVSESVVSSATPTCTRNSLSRSERTMQHMPRKAHTTTETKLARAK